MKKENLNSKINRLVKENFQSRLKEKDEAKDEEDISIEDVASEEDVAPEGDEAPSFEAPEGDDDGGGFGGGMDGGTKEVQDHLEAALESARGIGDEKLVDQIGNTITFFTRTHVVKEADFDSQAYQNSKHMGQRQNAQGEWVKKGTENDISKESLDESISHFTKYAGIKKQ